MLLPDVNVLLAGFRADHDHHRRTRTFLEEARSASDMLGVSDVALASVVRPTRAYSYDRTTPTRSSSTSMCCSTPGQLLRAGSTHWSRFSEFCRHLQLRGNLLSDAYLAALALEQGVELITFDRGFGRHPGLRWRCLLDE